ncbi:kinase-like protein, partial [Rhizoclosmatium globosum]
QQFSPQQQYNAMVASGIVPLSAVPQAYSSQSAQQQQQQTAQNQPQIIGSQQATSSSSSSKKSSLSHNIGEGSFGMVYEGTSECDQNQPVAIKFEPRKTDVPQLRDEYRTFKILAGSGTVGCTKVYYYGAEGLYNVLCSDMLGPTLEDMFDLYCCMTAKQMITRVQTVHEKNLIYRDIKPENFLIGRLPRRSELAAKAGNNPDPYGVVSSHTPQNPHPAAQIFIIDFGMAKLYRDPKTKQHIPYREKKSLSGTARYMSINTHLGRGSLPWQGLKAATNKEKYEKIGQKKQSTSVKDLCDGFPEEFGLYMKYCRELKFEETPDYDYLRGLMNKVLARIGELDDGVFDWMFAIDAQRREKERLREIEREKRERERALRHQQMASATAASTPATSSALAPLSPSPSPAPNPAHQSYISTSNNNYYLQQPQVVLNGTPVDNRADSPYTAQQYQQMQQQQQEYYQQQTQPQQAPLAQAREAGYMQSQSSSPAGGNVAGAAASAESSKPGKKKWWKKMFGAK